MEDMFTTYEACMEKYIGTLYLEKGTNMPLFSEEVMDSDKYQQLLMAYAQQYKDTSLEALIKHPIFFEFRDHLKRALERLKVEEQRTAIQRNASGITRQIEKEDRNILQQLFRKCAEQNDVAWLFGLMEYVRAEGIFYADHTDADTDTLIYILTLAIAQSKSALVYEDDRVLRFISTLFDIIFHQIRFEEFPAACTELYFDLISSMLDIEYDKLPNHEYALFQDGCNQSFYFIGMHDPLFKGKEAFLSLWEKMISRYGSKDLIDYFENWREAFDEL